MKELRRTITVSVYVSDDGKEFKTKAECEDHEKRLLGERKDCHWCKGCGVIKDDAGLAGDGIWIRDLPLLDIECPKCGGAGYLDLKTAFVKP